MLQSIDDTVIPATQKTRNNYLINGPTDIFLIGGLSILVFLLLSVTMGNTQPTAPIVAFIFYLSFAVNFPHFLVSYQLLYIDSRHLILHQPRFFWAAVIVPISMLTLFGLVIVKQQQAGLGYFANAMYFLVGWHYVKQIFGGIVVTNALQKIFYNKIERWTLQASLYSIWALSWVNSNVYASAYNFDGIPYQTFGLPQFLLPVCYWSTGITFLAVIFLHIRKYLRDKTLPTFSAMVCFAVIYVWYLPTLYNPIFFFIIPFFHSLQYLPFVYAFRRNKVQAEFKNKPFAKKTYFLQLYGYLFLAVITGATFFWFLPNYLDATHHLNPDIFGPTLAMFAFTVFINIHHFFIDNVIWKGSNPEVKKYLFQQHQ